MAPYPQESEVRDRKWACRLFASIAEEPREVIAFAYFDPEWRYLGTRHRASDDPGGVTVPIREVARDVLSLEARLVIMAHNHPSGDHRPARTTSRSPRGCLAHSKRSAFGWSIT